MLYFISDLHFFHKLLVKKGYRGYTDVDTMNSAVIDSINSVVGVNDTLYILGDLSFGKVNKTKELLDRIICKDLHWIIWNHDGVDMQTKLSSYFQFLGNYKELEHDGIKVVLMHYPIECWNGKEKGSIHLHGHLHQNQSHFANYMQNRFDLSWHETLCPKPVSIESIISVAQKERVVCCPLCRKNLETGKQLDTMKYKEGWYWITTEESACPECVESMKTSVLLECTSCGSIVWVAEDFIQKFIPDAKIGDAPIGIKSCQHCSEDKRYHII